MITCIFRTRTRSTTIM